jgi:hypothetical protein
MLNLALYLLIEFNIIIIMQQIHFFLNKYV